jgi:hypothetical protein
VQDHVHAGEAAGGGVLLLPVERDRRPGLVADFQQQRTGTAGRVVDGGSGTSLGTTDRITFRPEANGKREKSINVELRAPNGSNLKDQTQRHQLVSEKYLLRWGLVRRVMAAAA